MKSGGGWTKTLPAKRKALMRSVRLSVVDWELIKLAVDELRQQDDDEVAAACSEIITAIRRQTR